MRSLACLLLPGTQENAMSLIEDVRHGLRLLAKNRAFALATIGTLALGIGANTALFSVVNAVLLRPLPHDHPERIAVVWRTLPASPEYPHSAPDFLDVQKDSQSFESLAAYRGLVLDLSQGKGDPQRLKGAEVTSGFFDVFGTPAVLGRTLRANSDRPGDRLAVLSSGAWQRAFGSDPTVIGRSVRFGSVPMTVIGVMPATFAWPADTEAWVLADLVVPKPPLPVDDLMTQRALSYVDAVGRLKPTVTMAQAQTELDGIGRRLAEAFPAHNKDRGYRLVPIHEQLTGPMRTSLLTLLGVVGLVLLIASANVANLLLARGIGREREMAVRASLGASPSRLIRQLLVESVLLGIAGGLAGLALADQGTRLLVRLVPGDLPRSGEVTIDGGVLWFTLGVSVLSGLFFGIAPALAAARVQPLAALGAGGRASTGAGSRLRAVLVAAEIAVALVVLSGAGLLLRSFVRLQAVDPGYLTETVVAMPLLLPTSRYPSPPEQTRFYQQVVEGLRASGRYQVSAGYPAPLGAGAASAAPVRREHRDSSDADAMTLFSTVTSSYFQVLGIPLLAGRTFAETDETGKPSVVMISRAMAERFWPGEDPLGQRITLGDKELFTVVGIVGDVRRKGLDVPPEAMVYLHYQQFTLPFFHVFARGTNAAILAGDVRAVVRALDPELPLGAVATLAEMRALSMAAPRFRTVMLGLFAALGLSLAAVGLFGVVSDGVGRRARELGIRMALGAERGQILRLVLTDGLRISAWGTAIGLVASLALGRVIASFLFGVGAADPLTLAGVALGLMAVAGLAS
ncbi:MAG TPA: ABC transporter permease, partial [Vicinamibacteria bacterium]